MTEERMLRAFSELDMSAMPDPAFADRLYQSLTAELGLEPTARAAAAPGTLVVPARPVDAVGRARVRTRAPLAGRRTLLTLLAAALLLLGLMAGGLLIAGQLRPLTPAETIDRSRAVYAQAPAVRMVVTDDMGATTITGDGRGTWRSTSWDMAPGDYALYDGARTGWYTASTRSWQISPVESGGPPFPFNSEFTWTAISFPGLVATLDPVECRDATAGLPAASGDSDASPASPAAQASPAARMQVAGRETVKIICPTIGMTYWVDKATRLVLRTEAAEGSLYWRGPQGGPTVTEVTSFETVDSVDPADFDWGGPPLTARTGVIPGTRLVIGERPPSWSGTTIDGTPVSLPSPGAPMAVLFWDTWGESSKAADREFDTSAPATPGLQRLAVSGDPLGTLTGYRTQHPAGVPQVADPDGELTAAWGIGFTPIVVLLDAEGRVVELASARLAETDLNATLEALAAGAPAIVRAKSSSASPAPVTPQVTCDGGSNLVCVEPGELLPDWSGQASDGRKVSNATLAGLPAVLWLESPGMCDGTCPDWVRDLAAQMGDLARAYDGRASIVLVASGETEPGGTQALLDEAGATFDVVYDWDGTINRALRQQTNGALLLDADGRVQRQWVGAFDPAELRKALDGPLASSAP